MKASSCFFSLSLLALACSSSGDGTDDGATTGSLTSGDTGSATGGSTTTGGDGGLTTGNSTSSGGGLGTSTGGGTSSGGSLGSSGGEASSSGGDNGSAGGGSSTGGQNSGTGGAPPEPWQGEKYPFPQNVTYPHGVKSSKVDNQFIKDWYDNWSSKYLASCGAGVRPKTDPESESKVEAVGFAMMAAAYMGDRASVDALYTFYRSKVSNCGLMGWSVTCDSFLDSGAATDGDIDTAIGLLVAHWQWPDADYGDKAKRVIGDLKQMIVDCGGTSTLYPGCGGGGKWGGCGTTDVSYYQPAFFRYFAELTGDSAWSKLADDSHVIRDRGADQNTGLVPDWQSAEGGPPQDSGRKHYYSFDAVRTPFKHAMDYLWNGNASAGAWCKKITNWAYNSVGVENIVDGYQLNGTPEGGYHNMVVVGSLAVCSLANTQEVADAFVAESAKMKDDYWYGGFLGNLYLLAMSGNMWNPDIVD